MKLEHTPPRVGLSTGMCPWCTRGVLDMTLCLMLLRQTPSIQHHPIPPPPPHTHTPTPLPNMLNDFQTIQSLM